MFRPTLRAVAAVATFAALGATTTPLAAQPAVTPTHAYSLDGSLADAMGGPALAGMGGSVGPTGYAFGAGQGLRLSGISGSVYSIEMAFSLDAVSGYRKVFDFGNRLREEGLYVQNGYATFYGSNGTSSTTQLFAPDSIAHLVLTRDADARFTAYVDGVQALSFIDGFGNAVFGLDHVAHFLVDDARSGYEQAGGFLDYARLYDRALTGEQVRDRFARGDDPLGGDAPPPVTTTPEPATVTLMGAGLAALGLAARRRRVIAG